MQTQTIDPAWNANHPANLAFAEGWRAHEAGESFTANPYNGIRYDVHKRRAWHAGWLQACR
jgi:hypothetical protein